MKSSTVHKIETKASAPISFWKLAHARAQMNENQRITSITKGFDVSWATAVKSTFSMTPAHVGRLLNLSLSTYERRRKDDKPLDSAASERLDRLASVAVRAEDVFENKNKAIEWLTSPNEALGGESPVMRCETELGANQVRRVLNAIEWGGVV